MQRAKELAARGKRRITLKEIRENSVGRGGSDEEFLLRYITKGEQEVEPLREAGLAEA